MVGFNFMLLDIRTQAVFWAPLTFPAKRKKKKEIYLIFQLSWISLDAGTVCGQVVINAIQPWHVTSPLKTSWSKETGLNYLKKIFDVFLDILLKQLFSILFYLNLVFAGEDFVG